MKRWIAFLLLIITLSGTLVPCCAADDCCADELLLLQDDHEGEAKGSCSPFFSCASCGGFVETTKPLYCEKYIIEKPVHHERITAFHPATYSSSFWQPPRSC